MPALRELRTWMLGWLCAAGCGVAAGCATVPQGRAWLEVRTAHFEVHTDLREAVALDMARALEEARAGLLTLAWPGAADPRGRTEVAVFAREGRFHHYLRERLTEGLAQSRVGSERLVVVHWSDSPASGLPRAAVHEIAHDLSDWFSPLSPPWYSEGMASFLETFEYDRATQRARLGHVPGPLRGLLDSMGRRAPSAESLLEAHSALQGDVGRTRRFYLGSWLLVHYLVDHHREAFLQFRRDLSELRDWRDAWSDRFPRLGLDALDTGLQRYLTRARFEQMTATVELAAFSPQVRRLSPAEGYGLSSWIAYRLRAQQLSADDMQRALALDPDELTALRTRYQQLGGTSHAAERLSLARRLVRAHPESGEAWLLLARSARSVKEHGSALEQAARLMPEHPGVLELLAARALEAGDAAAALRYTDTLIRRTALGPAIAALHVRALALAGRCDAARYFARSVGASYSNDCRVARGGKSSPCLGHFEELLRQTCLKPPHPDLPTSSTRSTWTSGGSVGG
jgi:hypothetical protein